ncbi:esterase family protein [bacterium]|nr:esterase family protein [bacterium]
MKQWFVRWAVACLFCAAASMASAFTTETLQVPSLKMKKTIPATVVLPNSYKAGNQNFPVLYLLHGAGDNNNSWVEKTPIGELADIYQFLVVCPDAGKTSWYFDTDDPNYQYETFTSLELVKYIDAHYRTRANRGSRALCGNSMGGHGALFLAIRHSNVFGIAVGMSGGYDLRPFSTQWDINKRIGAFQQHPDRWEQLSVVTVAKSLKNRQIAISFECGVGDFFIDNNRALHNLLLDMKVDHDYTERPGVHGWVYWRPNIQYQALFIHNRFEETADGSRRAPVIQATPVQTPTPTATPTAKPTVKGITATKTTVSTPKERPTGETTEPTKRVAPAEQQAK